MKNYEAGELLNFKFKKAFQICLQYFLLFACEYLSTCLNECLFVSKDVKNEKNMREPSFIKTNEETFCCDITLPGRGEEG